MQVKYFSDSNMKYSSLKRTPFTPIMKPKVLNLASTDVDLKGFHGGFTDGRYGYFVPNNNGTYFGKVARILLAQSCHINGSI